MATRPNISPKIYKSVLYDSAYVCVICQKNDIHVHHIDQNPENNKPNNLVVLCQLHHGDAHTRRELTVNLSRERLRHAKKKWLHEVEDRRRKTATVAYQSAAAGEFLGIGTSWGYINHRRVSGLLTEKAFRLVDQKNLRICQERKLVDRNGIIISRKAIPSGSSYTRSSIYDQFEFGDDQRIHQLYSNFVDYISQMSQPTHIGEQSWSKAWFRQMVGSGSFIFLRKAHYFKTLEDNETNLVRLAYSFKKNVQIEYIVETRDMFGVSSMTVSFVGHKLCAAFLLVKSFEERDRKLIVHCTPIALGTGYWPLQVISEDSRLFEVTPRLEPPEGVILVR